MNKETYNYLDPKALEATPINLSEVEGLVIDNRGSYMFISLEGEENPSYVGLEYESRFSPGANHSREIARYLTEKKRISFGNRPSSLGYMGMNTLLSAFIPTFFSPVSPLAPTTSHRDGGGLESVFCPISMGAYKLLKNEFIRVLKLHTSLGFNDIQGGDGIHANMDLNMFGHDIDTRRETMANFFWFLFYNSEFMVEFSERKFNFQYNADMLTLLGDTLNLNPKGNRDTFLSSKNAFLDAVENGTYGRSLNMTINRDGRPAVEFRWFGSTHDPEKFMAMIEFCYAVTAFCRGKKSESTLSLQNFCSFVKANVNTYDHLFEVMRSNIYSDKYMNLATSTEQPVDRRRVTIGSM